MAKDIINRVTNSKLVTIDLEDYYPEGKRIVVDIKDWLFEELILKEKEFRAHVIEHDWTQYQDSFVALTCSSDAIIPSWAYILISTNLAGIAKKIVVGNVLGLETSIFQDIINNLDVTEYQDKPVIIKGCATKQISETTYVQLVSKLTPIARTIMYGEACSTVPLFKRKK